MSNKKETFLLKFKISKGVSLFLFGIVNVCVALL